MPELPEVETTRRGIAPYLRKQRIRTVTVRDGRLRWPVPANLGAILAGALVTGVRRRAKYLLIDTDRGSLIVHLGMSGSLRVVDVGVAPLKHDHVDLVLDSGDCLRLRDPRRFGCVLWCPGDALAHPLLASLGPEPLSAAFDGEVLYRKSRGRRVAVKSFIMNGRVVAGVGNIYANEALYRSGIHPARACGRISRARYARLAAAVKETLKQAIEAGGTTLRDFRGSDGEPGYFFTQLNAYDRAGAMCAGCGGTLRRMVIAQRASFFCSRCQR
jgi:formamidopyrimidine-DNA glycosylase